MEFSRDDTKIAKAVAIVLMLVHHLFAFAGRIPEGVTYTTFLNKNYEYTVSVFGKICVAMFICLSGYGAYKSYAGKDDVSKSVTRRVLTIYKKYWSVFMVFIPIGIVLGVERIELSIQSFVFNLVGYYPSYNGEWWFLPPFIVLAVLAPVIIRLVQKKRSSLWMDILIGIFLSALCKRIIPEIMASKYICHIYDTYFGTIVYGVISFIPTFWMGATIAKHRLFDICINRFRKWYISIPLSLIVMYIVILVRGGNDSLDFILAPVFIISSVIFLRNIKPLVWVAEKIGEVSTEMWLIHTFFCYHFIPEIIYGLKYAPFIILGLLIVTYISSKLLFETVRVVERIVLKLKKYNYPR